MLSEEGQPKGFEELYHAKPDLSVYRYRTGSLQVIDSLLGGQQVVITGFVHPRENGYDIRVVGYDKAYENWVGEFERDPRTFIQIYREEGFKATVKYPPLENIPRVLPQQMISTLIEGLELFDTYIHQVPIKDRPSYWPRITDEMGNAGDPLGKSTTIEAEQLPGMRGYPQFLLMFFKKNPLILDSIEEDS